MDPLEVYNLALLKRASSIVVAHNHPSGLLRPSRADKEGTAKLVEASRFLGIRLLDHLIISEKGFYSFLDEGEFEKMEVGKFVAFNVVLAMD
ncbi:MAG: hypothetical protein EOO01_09885 [Chitinophagaceae bacterium]|nr:MAG: hypothetical protein EOO01_09885 [Chitinophagaceae bacterium]